MSGKLIFVVGVSGSGKTTLIDAALEGTKNLKPIITTTTRRPREGEVPGKDYQFVELEDYERLRSQAEWDHTEIHGHSYGVDVSDVRSSLQQGANLICTVYPDIDLVGEMSRMYGVKPAVVFIDAPKGRTRRIIEAERPAQEVGRVEKEDELDLERLRSEADLVFVPEYKLRSDSEAFTQRIHALLDQ